MDEKGNVTGSFGIGAIPASCKACTNCKWAHGPAPWADTPLKSYCEIFPIEEVKTKPGPVMYDGAECLYFVEEGEE